MNIPRLLKVIEAVANTPPKLFSMRCWGQITECGTIGCAIGRYIIDNPRCGLRLYWEKDFRLRASMAHWVRLAILSN